MTTIESAPGASRPRGYRRFVGSGVGFGVLGGICCVGSAIAVGAGVGGLSFFTTWMNRYQMYVILASIVIMVAWLIRLARKNGARRGFAASVRMIWRQALAMGIVYIATLLIATMISGLIHS